MIKTWWLSKNQREQRLLLAGGVFFALVFFWYGVVVPLNNTISRQLQENRKLSESLVWIATETESQGLVKIKVLPTDMEKVVIDSALKAQLTITIQAHDDYQLTVTPFSPPTDKLVLWLDDLKTNWGLQPGEMQLAAEPENNSSLAVKKLVLQKAGSNG